jgi:hypothetical protein
MLTRDVLVFYATAFVDGDFIQARRILNKKNSEIRRQDAITIFFFLGLSVVLVLLLCTIIAIPSTIEVDGWKESLSSCIVAYYFLFVIIFIVFATGFCIKVFRAYGINYTYIFELDQGTSSLMHD